MTLKDQHQRDIVLSGSKNFFVSAAAGTGKSTLLARKITRLLENEQQIPIEHLIAITYTNKAADDLRSKVELEISNREQDPSLNPSTRQHLRTCILDLPKMFYWYYS